MKSMKTISAEDFKIQGSFQTIRETLLQEQFADRLQKPLAYWALPNDRRLPLAFLGRTVGELLNTPFDELSSTPGIGQKKIRSLVGLLQRAIEDSPPEALLEGLVTPAPTNGNANGNGAEGAANGHFDPSTVSESMWVQWRDTVRRFGLGSEKLGRLAISLQSMPTVIWHTPLEAYLDRSLSQIRELKTHGEKRVRVILEVFYTVHKMLHGAAPHDHLTIRLAPRFIPPVESWIDRMLREDVSLDASMLCENLVAPLLAQIKHDLGETIFELAAGRLGYQRPQHSVRTLSRRMGVTRARVYQLLEECGKAMEVRWPDGARHFADLTEKLERDGVDSMSLSQFVAAHQLFYPTRFEDAEEPMGSATY